MRRLAAFLFSLLICGSAFAANRGPVQSVDTVPSGSCSTYGVRVLLTTGNHYCCSGYAPPTAGTWALCDQGAGAGSGDMLKAVYDADNNSNIEHSTHATDCTSLTCDANSDGEICLEQDDDVLYACDGPAATWVSGGGGSGDMLKTTYDSDDDGSVDTANALLDEFPVKEYGALCDNIADDTTEIQAAIDAAKVVTEGGIVSLPPGTCRVSGLTITDGHSVVFRGSGSSSIDGDTAGTRLFLINGSNDDLIHISSTGGKDRAHIVVEHVGLDGNAANQTIATCTSSNTCTGIKIGNQRNVTVRDVKVWDTGGDGIYIESLSNRVVIRGNDIENAGSDGIDVASGGDVMIVNNQIGWSGVHKWDDASTISCGIQVSNGIIVQGNRVYQSIGHDFCVSGNRNIFTGNWSDGATQRGMSIANGSDNIVAVNRLMDHGVEFTRDTGSANTQAGVFIGATSSRNLIFGNQIGNQTKGFGAESVVADHQDYGVYCQGDGNLIRANTISQNDLAGIFLHADAADNVVEGNDIEGENIAIHINGGEDNLVISNDLRGNVKGVFADNSADDNSIERNNVQDTRVIASTTLSSGVLGGATSLSVASEVGFAVGDPVYVTANGGLYFVSRVVSTAAGTINIDPEAPGTNDYTLASATNAVANSLITHGIQIASGTTDTYLSGNRYGGAATDDFLDNGTNTIADENRLNVATTATNSSIYFIPTESITWGNTATEFQFSDDVDIDGDWEVGSTHTIDSVTTAAPRIRFFDGDTADEDWEIVNNSSQFFFSQLTNGGGFISTPFKIDAGAPTNSFHIMADGKINEVANLSTIRSSGSGTVGDPWDITAANFATINGGLIEVPTGYYEVPFADSLDASDTTIRCADGAVFTRPGTQQTVANPMFIAATGDFTITGCTFEPGIVVNTGRRCQTPRGTCSGGSRDGLSCDCTEGVDANCDATYCISPGCENCPGGGTCSTAGRDTVDGIQWIELGTDESDSEDQTYIITGNTFGHCRRDTNVADVSAIYIHGAHKDSRIEGNTFGVCEGSVDHTTSDTSTAGITVSNFSIKNNTFDNADLLTVPCQPSPIDHTTFDFDLQSGRTNLYTFNNFTISHNLLLQQGIHLEADFDAYQFSFTHNRLRGEQMEEIIMDRGVGLDWTGADYSFNYCIDDDGDDNSRGCELFMPGGSDITVQGNHISTWCNDCMRGGGGAGPLRIIDNFLDANEVTGSAEFFDFSSGSYNDVIVRGNTVIDVNDFFGGSAATIDGLIFENNVFGATTVGNIDSWIGGLGTCTNCIARNLFMVGDIENVASSWAQFDVVENVHTSNVHDAEATLVSNAAGFTISDGSGEPGSGTFPKWNFQAGSGDSIVWTNPGINVAIDHARTFPASVVAGSNDGSGGIGWQFTYAPDVNSTFTVSPDSHTTSGAQCVVSRDNAQDWDSDVMKCQPTGTGTQTNDFHWSDTTVGNYVLEIWWEKWHGDGTSCDSGTPTVLIEYCESGTGCTPSTTIENDTAAEAIGMRYSRVKISDSTAADDVVIRFSYTHNSSAGINRCKGYVYGIRLNNAPFDINPMFANEYNLVPGMTGTPNAGLTSTAISWTGQHTFDVSPLVGSDTVLDDALTDDNVLLGNASNVATATAINDCDAAGNALTYDITTNAFGCNTGLGGGGADWEVDGVGVTVADLRSDGDVDSILCTGVGAPDASCAAADDVIWRINANAINSAGEIDGALCGTNEILEDQGASWACISTPSGGAEVNNLETTDPPNVLDNEVYVGSGAAAGSWIALSTCGAGSHLDFNGTAFECESDADTPEVNNLETTDPPNVLDNEVYVGSGVAAGSWIAISQCGVGSHLDFDGTAFACESDADTAEVNNLETTDPPNVLDDEVYIGSGAAAGAWQALPDCNATDQALNYDQPTNALSCATITHTSDTNANTICTGTTTYLDGEGNCDTITSGPDVKSGEINITEGTPGTVTFNTAFSGTPWCNCTLEQAATDATCWISTDATTTAVSFAVDNSTGGNGTYDVNWICTDAGDP